MRSDWYLYVKFRETFEPFYVGIGSTRDRWVAHEAQARGTRRLVNPHKVAIIRKMWANGWTDIPTVKIATGLTYAQACTYEIAWIAAVGRADLGKGPLTNRTDGGDANPNRVVSPETRAKLAEIGRRRVFSAEMRAKLSESHRNQSPETRAKISKASRNQIRSPEWCAKIAETARGRIHSPETRAKLAEAARKRTVSPETRAKMAEAGRNQMRSLEYRAKISKANRGLVRSPEMRARSAEAARNRWAKHRAAKAAAAA